MNAKLLIEGKEFDIEILDPKLQELLAPSKKKTGYERVGKSERHYYATDDGSTDDFCEDWDEEGSEEYYNGANYYSDESVAANNSRADKLMRQLRRFAVEHRKTELNWKQFTDKWFIYYDYDSEDIETSCDDYTKTFGTIYFDSMVVADDAINTFRDELIWYFTEYKDSL
jgi:hypothetical protein